MTFRPRLRFRPFFAGTACAGLAGGLLIGWIGSEQFVVPTRRALEPRHREALAHPAEFGLEIDTFTVSRPGGTGGAPLLLEAALLSPAARPGKAEKTRRMRDRLRAAGQSLPGWGQCRGTVVMLHGRSGIKEDAFPVAERFVAGGFRCLIYDARAHGRSGGRFTTFGAAAPRRIALRNPSSGAGSATGPP